jgi:hypothetical protein
MFSYQESFSELQEPLSKEGGRTGGGRKILQYHEGTHRNWPLFDPK